MAERQIKSGFIYTVKNDDTSNQVLFFNDQEYVRILYKKENDEPVEVMEYFSHPDVELDFKYDEEDILFSKKEEESIIQMMKSEDNNTKLLASKLIQVKEDI